jgi:hypothetical protein
MAFSFGRFTVVPEFAAKGNGKAPAPFAIAR